jgi:hypothetical protein
LASTPCAASRWQNSRLVLQRRVDVDPGPQAAPRTASTPRPPGPAGAVHDLAELAGPPLVPRSPAGRPQRGPTAHASGFPPNVLPWGAGGEHAEHVGAETTADTGTIPPPSACPGGRGRGRRPRARRRTSTRCGRARLDLVGDQQHPVPVADLPERGQVAGRRTTTPASPWIGSISTATVVSSIDALDRGRVAIGHDGENPA